MGLKMIQILLLLYCIIPINGVIYNLLRDSNGYAVKATGIDEAKSILQHNHIQFPVIQNVEQLNEITKFVLNPRGFVSDEADATLVCEIGGDILNEFKQRNRKLAQDEFTWNTKPLTEDIYYLVYQQHHGIQHANNEKHTFYVYPILSEPHYMLPYYYILFQFNSHISMRLDPKLFVKKEFFAYIPGGIYLQHCNGLSMHIANRHYIRSHGSDHELEIICIKQSSHSQPRSQRPHFTQHFTREMLLFLQWQMQRYTTYQTSIPIQILPYNKDDIMLIRPIDPKKKIIYLSVASWDKPEYQQRIGYKHLHPVKEYFLSIFQPLGENGIVGLIAPNSDNVYNTINILNPHKMIQERAKYGGNHLHYLLNYPGIVVFSSELRAKFASIAEYRRIYYNNWDKFWNYEPLQRYTQFVPMMQREFHYTEKPLVISDFVGSVPQIEWKIVDMEDEFASVIVDECITWDQDIKAKIKERLIKLEAVSGAQHHTLYLYRSMHSCPSGAKEVTDILQQMQPKPTIISIEMDPERFYSHQQFVYHNRDFQDDMGAASQYASDNSIPLIFNDIGMWWRGASGQRWIWFRRLEHSIYGEIVPTGARNHIFMNSFNWICTNNEQQTPQTIFAVIGAAHYTVDDIERWEWKATDTTNYEWIKAPLKSYPDELKTLITKHLPIKPLLTKVLDTNVYPQPVSIELIGFHHEPSDPRYSAIPIEQEEAKEIEYNDYNPDNNYHYNKNMKIFEDNYNNDYIHYEKDNDDDAFMVLWIFIMNIAWIVVVLTCIILIVLAMCIAVNMLNMKHILSQIIH